jgi:hypothetical protein
MPLNGSIESPERLKHWNSGVPVGIDTPKLEVEYYMSNTFAAKPEQLT